MRFSAPPLRDLLPLLLGFALVVLAGLAISSTGARNEAIERTVLAELRGEVREHVGTWEAGILRDLDDTLASLQPVAGDRQPGWAELQERIRRRYRWFDSLYVRAAPMPGGAAGVAFPVGPPATTTPTIRDLACGVVGDDASLPPAVVATALTAACSGANLPAVIHASTAAAARLERQGDYEHALNALRAVSVNDAAPVNQLVRGGVPAMGVVRRRLQLTALQLRLGRTDEGRTTARLLVDDVSALDAPSLEVTLLTVESGLDALAPLGIEANALRARLMPAAHRLDAARAATEELSRPAALAETEGPRFVLDATSGSPMVLYARPAGRDGVGVVLALRLDRLIEDFLRGKYGRYRDALVVIDASGRTLRTPAAASAAPGTVVPFSLALRGLRVGLTTTYTGARVRPLQEGWVTWRNLATAVCIVLGFGALWASVRADRQHKALLQRQREFTTRVTHELKTPLAGIKVMAENLAAGAWRDEAHRQTMAERIVTEADRLTERVNEVLSVSQKRELPAFSPVDLEDVLYGLIDAWGPRYEEAGLAFHAEIDPLDPVLGDATALRDALSCLLDNALKYRRDGDAATVWLNVREDEGQAEIEVLDNGIGVPTAQREVIFQRFVRVEGPGRGMAGGHGLGLAQVAEIVAAHKGTVRCDAGVDGGSRFVVRLPLIA